MRQRNKARTKCPYLVKVTADCLYIRNGTGISSVKTGRITNRRVYMIVDEKKGRGSSLLGKLKSGGWISLDCAKKL